MTTTTTTKAASTPQKPKPHRPLHSLAHTAACRHAIVPLIPTCPRQLIVKYLSSAGFGHQFTELLFGMYAAQYLGLTFTWSAFATSQDHGDDYTGLVTRLGLERFFVEGLGLARADDLRELLQSTSAHHDDRPNNITTTTVTFGEWIEASHMDKRNAIQMMSCDNSVMAIEGWWHCRAGIADNNCFWAPEHEGLFQRFGDCLRAGVEVYGEVMDRCVFVDDGDGDGDGDGAHRYQVSHDTLVVVWHLRFGDVAPHKPGDAFFDSVVRALKKITPAGLIKRVRIVLVGGGKGISRVPDDYVESLRRVVAAVVVGADRDGTHFSVEHFRNSSFEEQFVAMMQADVLVGSGSSVPQVAALLSPGKPIFFNHVAKHGYGYGQEVAADSVDMDGQGKVLESLRRVKTMVVDRLVVGGGDEGEEGKGGGRIDPCRRRRTSGGKKGRRRRRRKGTLL
jgi:hypothetical protein